MIKLIFCLSRSSIILCILLLLSSCASRSSYDYHLVEHIEHNKIPMDSDLELLSSLEHHRQPRSQAKKNEQYKHRLERLFKIIQPAPKALISKKKFRQTEVEASTSQQPGLVKLGVLVGSSAIPVYEFFK